MMAEWKHRMLYNKSIIFVFRWTNKRIYLELHVKQIGWKWREWATTFLCVCVCVEFQIIRKTQKTNINSDELKFDWNKNERKLSNMTYDT